MENRDEIKRLNLFIIDDHEWFKDKSNSEVGQYYWDDGGDRNTANPEEVYFVGDERAEQDSFLKDQKPPKKINL